MTQFYPFVFCTCDEGIKKLLSNNATESCRNAITEVATNIGIQGVDAAKSIAALAMPGASRNPALHNNAASWKGRP